MLPILGSMVMVSAPRYVCTFSATSNFPRDNSRLTIKVPSPLELNASLDLGSNPQYGFSISAIKIIKRYRVKGLRKSVA
jgi:hypothetical protein